MKNLYELFLKQVDRYPGATALSYESLDWTYLRLNAEILKTVAKLRSLGVKKGDIVALNLPNCPQAVTIFYAINAIGAIAYLIHPLTPAAQLATFLKKTDCRYFFCLSLNAKDYAQEIKEAKIIAVNLYHGVSFFKALAVRAMSGKLPEGVLPYERLKGHDQEVKNEFKDHEPCVYLNSGGTNGEPKVIMLSNEAIGYLGLEGLAIIGVEDPTTVKMLTVIPMFHGFGLAMGVVAPLSNGATTVLMTKFHSKEACALLSKNRANTIIGVPALYNALLSSPYFKEEACRNLFVAYVGGDNVTKTLIDSFNSFIEKEGGKAKLFEGYGLTETVTVSNVNRWKECKEGTVGRPLRGIKEVILSLDDGHILGPNEEGEVAISGPALMEGYFMDPGLTEQTFKVIDGEKYVLTKDLGFLDEDGYLHFRQRLRRVAKVNGVPVCPSDLEKLALEDPNIYEAYAYPVKDERLGSVLELALVKRKQSQMGEKEIEENILAEIAKNLPVYYRPKKLYFLEALPRTAVGKIDSSKFPE